MGKRVREGKVKRKGTACGKALCYPHLEAGNPGTRLTAAGSKRLLLPGVGGDQVLIYVEPLESCLPEEIPG